MRFKLPALARPKLGRHGVFFLLLAICLVQWAILFSPEGPSWDAAVYYAYARSMVFDQDLQIANDLRLSYPTASQDFAAARLDLETTGTGRVASPFAIGSSLLWAPWLAILRGLAGLGQLAGLLPASLTGYEWYFTLGLASLSMIMGWLAFWLAYRLACQISDRNSALLAAVTLLFATPLLFYMYANALFAHATSAFINAIFVAVWWRYFRRPGSYAAALAIGGLLGLASLVRWQHIVYGVLPFSAIAYWWWSLPAAERRKQLRRALLLALGVGLGAAAVLTLQLFHWRLLFGQLITVPQGAGFMDWAAPYWRPVLFSSFKGLLTWMPVFFLALAGLLIQLKKQRRFLLPLLIVLILETYINSSSADWFGGGGYGPRRFTGELAILVIGYAGLLQWLPGKIRPVASGLAALLLALQQWVLLRYGLADEIGGRLLSMVPDYRWAEDGYPAFWQQLGARTAGAFRQPLEMLHWPGSPAATIAGGRLPTEKVLALAATGLFVGLCWLAARRLLGREISFSGRQRWTLLIVLAAVIVGLDVWLLAWA
jgi:hypothetical protein